MKKIIVSTLLVLCGISYSSNFVALVSPKASKYEHETPTPPTPPKVEKNLIMTVGSNVNTPHLNEQVHYRWGFLPF